MSISKQTSTQHRPLAAHIGIAVLLLVLASPAFAQTAAQKWPAPSGSPPDLTGVWRRVSGAPLVTADGQPAPMQPWADAENRKALADQEARNKVDPRVNCLPEGATDVMFPPYPFSIIQGTDAIAFLFEYNQQSRIVHMNARHPANLTPSWYGHSVGRWEGNTLVVDTIGFNGKPPLFVLANGPAMRGNIPHTDALHLTERFSLTDGGRVLRQEMTMDDPKTFTRVWTAIVTFAWRPDLKLVDNVCAENNRTLEEH